MKTDVRIGMAFLLNMSFAIAESVGGLLFGSVAVLSDAVHDFGDAVSIGLALWLEKKSRRAPDGRYTYGYGRYSVFGGLFTTLLLLIGSATVMLHAIGRLRQPTEVDTGGVLWMAAVGLAVNAVAAFVTHGGASLNQRAVNLHMLEDVLGWAVVLVGAVVMCLTGWTLLDPLLSVGVSLFVIIKAIGSLRDTLSVLAEGTPAAIVCETLAADLTAVDGVRNVHHLHVWSLDGIHHAATLHAVIDGDASNAKARMRAVLKAHDITHVTLETESPEECCEQPFCRVEHAVACGHAHPSHGSPCIFERDGVGL